MTPPGTIANRCCCGQWAAMSLSASRHCRNSTSCRRRSSSRPTTLPLCATLRPSSPALSTRSSSASNPGLGNSCWLAMALMVAASPSSCGLPQWQACCAFSTPAAAGRRLPTGPARAATGDSRWCAASAGCPALTGRAPAEGTGDLRGGGIMVEQRQLAKQGAVGRLQRDAQARQRRLIQ